MHHSAAERSAGHPARAKRGLQTGADRFVIEFAAARKNIDGGIGVLGPGMNRHVRFGDDYDAAHAVRAEIVEEGLYDRASAVTDRITKQFFDLAGMFETPGVTTVKLQQRMMRERAHQAWIFK